MTYGLLAYAQRRQLHRAAAGWYECAHAADTAPVVVLLAHHWTQAGDPPKAFGYLRRAGAQSFARFANREAADFLRQALALAHEPAPAERADCERLLGYAKLWLGEPAESRAHLERHLALGGRPVPATRAGLVAGIGWQFVASVFNHLRGRRRRADGADARDSEIAESLLRYAHIAYFMTDTPRLLYASLRCLNFAARAELSREVAVIYAAMVSGAAALPLHGLARYYGAKARAAAGALDDPAVTAQVLLFDSLYGAGVGAWAACRTDVERAGLLARGVGDLRRVEDCLVVGGYLRYFTGDFAGALAHYREAVAAGQRRGDRQTAGWGALGVARVELARGQLQAALAALGEAAPSITDRLGGIELQGLRAQASLAAGDRGAALTAARAGLALLREAPAATFSTLTGSAGVAAAMIALEDGTPSGATAHERSEALRLLGRFARVFPIGRPRLWLQRGDFRQRQGRFARALAAWRRASAAAQALDMPYDELLAQQALARHAAGAEAAAAAVRTAALEARLGLAPVA